MDAKKLRDGEPCKHPGCLSHISHPCEGCGRIGGRAMPMDDKTAIELLRNSLNVRVGFRQANEIADLIETLSANAVLGTVVEKLLRENCELLRQSGCFDGNNCNMKCKYKDICRLRGSGGAEQ